MGSAISPPVGVPAIFPSQHSVRSVSSVCRRKSDLARLTWPPEKIGARERLRRVSRSAAVGRAALCPADSREISWPSRAADDNGSVATWFATVLRAPTVKSPITRTVCPERHGHIPKSFRLNGGWTATRAAPIWTDAPAGS